MDLNYVALVVVLILLVWLIVVFVLEIRRAIRQEKKDWLAKRLRGKSDPPLPKRPPPPKPKRVKYRRHRR